LGGTPATDHYQWLNDAAEAGTPVTDRARILPDNRINLLVAWQNNGPASPPLRQRVSGKRQLKGRNKRTEIGTPAESIPSTRQCNSPQQRASLSFFAAQKVKSLLTPDWVGHWRQDNERLSAATLTSPLLICNTSHYRPPKVALPLLRERTTHHLRPLSTTQRSDFFVEVISFCAAFVPAFLYRLQVQANSSKPNTPTSLEAERRGSHESPPGEED